jgi:hypothetical protein
MKTLLTVTAAIEGGTGLLLIFFPSMLTGILLGESLETPVAITIARIAGVAILAIAAICWLNRNDVHGSGTMGLVKGLIIYNAGASAILIWAGTVMGLSCTGLWCVVIIHLIMCIWCVRRLFA